MSPRTFRPRRVPRAAVFSAVVTAALLAPAVRAAAAVTVHADFSGFDARLDTLTSAHGLTAFTADERAAIRGGVLSGMASVYDGFAIAFTPDRPATGDYKRVRFGDTDATTSLGRSDWTDYRSTNPNAAVNVFSAKFGFALSAAGADRAAQVSLLSTALSGTASHELGHAFGLCHCDAYGDPRITSDNYAATGGAQNDHVMATGSTGLSWAQRLSPRAFSPLEEAKLEFAAGLTPYTPAPVSEADARAAGPLALNRLPLSGYRATSLIGNLDAPGETDVYTFVGRAGDLLTAQLLSDNFRYSLDPRGVSGADPRAARRFDAALSLLSADGATLFANDDLSWRGNALYTSATGTEGTDPAIFNFRLPADGAYRLRVSGGGADAASQSGYYEMFVGTLAVGGTGGAFPPAENASDPLGGGGPGGSLDGGGAAAPEPSSLALIALVATGGVSARAWRRRRAA